MLWRAARCPRSRLFAKPKKRETCHGSIEEFQERQVRENQRAGVETKKLSALDAAAKVLAETKQAMSCKEMIEAMGKKGNWSSPGGKTPESTLYSAVLKELTTKGKESRLKKTERGRFARA
ncbi:MAG TPA: HTH domain-containing protein [Gemmataceae bacterium]|jgi:hypothetical protein|nr:HTH domain-containing protein [Gemmataceae bacterium]